MKVRIRSSHKNTVGFAPDFAVNNGNNMICRDEKVIKRTVSWDKEVLYTRCCGHLLCGDVSGKF